MVPAPDRPPPDLDLSRMAVVGTSCCGKTTFSRRLARALRIEHVRLDDLYWRPGWTHAMPEEFRSLADEVTRRPRWIVDGSYMTVSDLVWARATTLIWLDLPFHVCFGRAWKRTVVRLVTREVLFAGNRERWNVADPNWIPWWVVRTHHRRRREYQRRLRDRDVAHLRVCRLRSLDAAERLLASIEAAAGSGGQMASRTPS